MLEKRDTQATSHAIQSSSVQAPEIDPQQWADSAGRAISEDQRTPILFRHSGWQRTRRLVAESLSRTEQTFARTSEFRHCGLFAYVLRSVEDPEKFRVAGSCCRDRFCLPCATERSYVIAGNVLERIDGKEIRFLTLTIKTAAEPLTQQLNKLYSSFQALRRRAIWKKGVRGGVAFLELKWSENGQRWHPHLHCLMEGTWLDQVALKRIWKQITGDSYVLDIRRPPNNIAVTRYVSKYASKPFNNTFVNRADLLDEAVLALAGRKLAVTYGTWRGLLLTATPDEGCWEHVAPLDTIIAKAAAGNQECRLIMASLTDRDLSELYARAPPIVTAKVERPKSDGQATFFGAWQQDGTYKYPAE